MVWQKHQGGLGELRHHIRRRDLIRGKEKLYRTTEKQSEEEDGVQQAPVFTKAFESAHPNYQLESR